MILVSLHESALQPTELLQKVCSDEAGGIVSFIGTVRNQTNGRKVKQLIFETYDAMALKEMNKIAQNCLDRWPVVHLLIAHRKGMLAIGEIPVVIIAVAPHRIAAFEACQYAIDELKRTVPIWKKEVYEDGEIWVSAHP